MQKLIYLFTLLVCLSSCATLEPKIWDRKDPFTLVRKRSMYVLQANYFQYLEALSSPISSSPYSYNRYKTPVLPINNFLTLIVEEGDTLLTYMRFIPDNAYDIPADARMQLLLSDPGHPHKVINLPLKRPYHTINGPIIATGLVNSTVIKDLLNEPIRAIRIDKVSTNQAFEEPVTWDVSFKYNSAFQKGVGMLFPSFLPSKPVKVKKPKKALLL